MHVNTVQSVELWNIVINSCWFGMEFIAVPWASKSYAVEYDIKQDLMFGPYLP